MIFVGFKLDYESGYKQWLFDKVSKEINSKERIGDADTQFIKHVLDKYYDSLKPMDQFELLIEKLKQKANSVIIQVEEVADNINFFSDS